MIKLVLLVGVCAVAFKLLQGGQSSNSLALKRLLGLTLLVTGVASIVWPAGVTVVARHLGVGRGTDLLLYIGVLMGSFALVSLYLRLQHTEAHLTTLVRELALVQEVAQRGTPAPGATGDLPMSQT